MDLVLKTPRTTRRLWYGKVDQIRRVAPCGVQLTSLVGGWGREKEGRAAGGNAGGGGEAAAAEATTRSGGTLDARERMREGE